MYQKKKVYMSYINISKVLQHGVCQNRYFGAQIQLSYKLFGSACEISSLNMLSYSS